MLWSTIFLLKELWLHSFKTHFSRSQFTVDFLFRDSNTSYLLKVTAAEVFLTCDTFSRERHDKLSVLIPVLKTAGVSMFFFIQQGLVSAMDLVKVYHGVGMGRTSVIGQQVKILMACGWW